MVKILRETKKKKKKKKIKENIERQFFAHLQLLACLVYRFFKGVGSVFSKRVHTEATFYDL
jgi:hypothetical protein